MEIGNEVFWCFGFRPGRGRGLSPWGDRVGEGTHGCVVLLF